MNNRDGTSKYIFGIIIAVLQELKILRTIINRFKYQKPGKTGLLGLGQESRKCAASHHSQEEVPGEDGTSAPPAPGQVSAC